MPQAARAEDADFIDVSLPDLRFDLARWVLQAKKRYGKSYLAQIWEVWRLKHAAGRLMAWEYYAYRLFDDRRFDFAAKREFVGKLGTDGLYEKLNDWDDRRLSNDKLSTAEVLESYGIPTPRIVALYHPSRRFGDVPRFADPEALACHLRAGLVYPAFGKPVMGSMSLGVISLRGYERDGDSLVLADGRRVPVARFLEGIAPFFPNGYLFQEHLDPHPALKALCGPRLSTVRVMVLLAEGGAELTHAVWKVPVGDNVADNNWRAGNLLAALDPESGTVTRVARGLGPDEEEVERHPDTEAPLLGARLPEWQRLRRLCLESATLFPGLRLQAWDIALCPQGPVINEVNGKGAVDLPQRALGRGILDARLRRAMARVAA